MLAAETIYSLADIRPRDVHLGMAMSEPFDWSYSERAFPPAFYAQLLENLPGDEAYTDKTYKDRLICDIEDLHTPFWESFCESMLTFEFMERVIAQYPRVWKKGPWKPSFRLVRDKVGYAISPHTDIRQKAITCLFYLPKDDSMRDYGTQIYVPKQQAFTSDGNTRFKASEFTKYLKSQFMPNSVFSFERSDVSFHGVEPIGDVVRDTLLYNVDIK